MADSSTNRAGRRPLGARFFLALAFLCCLSAPVHAGSFNSRIVGYFVQWGIYARDYEPADIPAQILTHINYAFMAVNAETGQLSSYDAWADLQKVFAAKNGLPAQTWDQSAANLAGNFGRLRDLKALYPHMKVLLSVGGWTLSGPFPAVAADAAKRQAFAASAADWVSGQGFDGIDIDWEYPSLADRDNFSALIEATRQALDAKGLADGKTYLLTVAAPAGPSNMAVWDLARLAPSLDWFNIMTYDYHGGWDATTGHLAPLYENPADPSADRATWNADWAVQAYLAGGVPAQKIHLGIPFYGRSWEAVPATDNGLFQSGQAGPNLGVAGNWENGVLDYWKAMDIARDGSHAVNFDTAARAPFIYGANLSSGLASGGLFVTFENTASLTEKLARAKTLGLGGVMFWELSGDVRDVTDADSLLGLMARTLTTDAAATSMPWLMLLLDES
ncbi:glycoside hydrolase family 18 protein [Desulfolutivibrio sp.]|uniref:glycoside hydrolase family 18 protein n=1 Tax=Desulfolutivibrio sp. TaxID=2773296 RepID=UPI002F9692DC